MTLIDSHCHLNFPELINRMPEVLKNAAANDVHRMLCIATSWENQPEVLKLAEENPEILAAVGIHPTTEGGYEATTEELIAATAHERVVAIGETGLDYFRTTGDLTWQHERFHRHIEAGRATNLPIIIHTRAAAEDTMNTLREHKAEECGGVMHCFAEDWEVAKQALDIGFYISFSGIVTFKSAKAVQEVAEKAPLDRILVETDSPYLAPTPHRGKTNEPAYTKHTAEFVAELRGVDYESVRDATTHNFYQLFSKAKPERGTHYE